MDAKGTASPGGFKITCKDYPHEFNLDKNIAKEYFRQFGKLKRITFKQKLRICVVEYLHKEGFLKAFNNAGEYDGNVFDVYVEKSEVKKKKTTKRINPLWVDEDEIQQELRAMSGIAPKSYEVIDLTDSLSESPKQEKGLKSKRSWKADVLTTPRKKVRSKEKTGSEHVELINLVLSQAITKDEKFRALDARDKLLRVKLKKSTQLKSKATLGTCPDMCPEKERLMRETQHQVALYEQEDNGKAMNYRKAVKQYSRSSADQESPLSHELRPVPVLQMTMCYLMHNIIDICDTPDVNLAEWYHFLWDRTRGIRKDITQQELCSRGAVELVEQCARFHIHCSARLVAEEPSVFDQKINTENLTKCLQTLKYMYHDLQLKAEYCPNEAEFRAYIILLNVNDGNFMCEVQELREEIQKSKEVKFALEVYAALDKNNYVKFFKLVNATTYLNACILMRYFVQVRTTALKILLKCYSTRALKTTYPLNELTTILGFDDLDATVYFMQSYGLSINEERTHIFLRQNMFASPEIPYVLDRSLNVVESKRTHSVGRVVCGKDLPPKTYEAHVLQNSFDQKGYLLSKDFLDESDLEQAKLKLYAELEENSDSDTPKPSVPAKAYTGNLFKQNAHAGFGSIFAKAVPASKEDTTSIFGLAFNAPNSIFSTETQIFGNVKTVEDQVDAALPAVSVKPLDKIEPNIFQASSGIVSFKPATQRVGNVTPGVFPVASTFGEIPVEPKKGGFTFSLPQSAAILKSSSNVSDSALATTGRVHLPSFSSQDTMRKMERDAGSFEASAVNVNQLEKLQDEEKIKRELDERKKREEREILEKKKEEEKLRELQRKRREEEDLQRLEALKKEMQLNREIKNTVKELLDSMIVTVDEDICEEKMAIIRKSIQSRMLLRVYQKWRDVLRKNKRKRKAMDCSPVWINTKTLSQSANEFHSSSQDLTLALMKRYKYGKSLDIGNLNEDKITKINLSELTYATLKKRYYGLTGKSQKRIYWKVTVSLPDGNELVNGATRIEETLDEAFKWENAVLVDHVAFNNAESVTYCVEKQKGMEVKESDANGIIFVAKDFNSALQRRIFENLKGFGVFTKVPIVIILQEYDENDCKLRALTEAKIVSDYIILKENLIPQTLLSLVEEGLVFLASKAEKSPPLELDTFYSFMEKYLCTEMWKRANSFAKWNSQYKTCLRDPTIVIGLYNDALSKLKKIALNKSCREYATFPEVFNDYLPNEIPDYLPCNYYYFPKFWKTQLYIYKLEKILKGLSLPKWQDKWPPSTEFELEVSVSKYCTKAFKDPERAFYKIMSVFLREVDPRVNFQDVANVLWTDIIEVLGLEKLRVANLGLSGTEFENKSIYNQYIVIYDTETVQNYSQSDWFYINNPVVKKCMKQQFQAEKKSCHEESRLETSLVDDFDVINKATRQLLEKSNQFEMQKDLSNISALLNDLETSIKIHKKISSTIEENLKKAILEN